MRRQTRSKAFMTLTVRKDELKEELRKEREKVNKEKCNKKRNKLASNLLMTQDRLQLNENILQFIS